MKQSVPKTTVAGGRHACHRRCMVSDSYFICDIAYKSSLRFKDEKRSLKKVLQSHTIKAYCGRFRVMEEQNLLPFRNSNKFIRI